MITIKSKEQIEKMGRAGRILADCHKEIAKMIRPGITSWEIDQFVEGFLTKHGATPEQKGYHGYPYATCASVNDVICHGFPKKEPLNDGDIVTIDMVVRIDGWLADSAWSYAVGNISPVAEKLLQVTKESLYKGIEQAVPATVSAMYHMPFRCMRNRMVFPLSEILSDTGLAPKCMKSRKCLIMDQQVKGRGLKKAWSSRLNRC